MSTLSESAKTPEAVAIIGMACIFPKAGDIQTFWRNITAALDAIDDPLPEWEANRYLSSERIHTSRGGYLKDLFRFDPLSYGIMPKSMDGGEPDHFLALRVAREALSDAGYASDQTYDHRETGIVLGHSTYLHRGQANHIQHHIILDQTIELLEALFPAMNADQKSAVRNLLLSKLPHSYADNAPGLVPNVMTGRIANRLNLRGPNYIVDGACASSLLAVNAAMDELRSGRSRMMLAGGVNASLPAEASVIFTQLDALSKSGRVKPFDESCDGTLLGEGLGMLVLKCLSDAIKDDDRIYAIIRSMGIASDGKAFGLLAPNMAGEALAIERAYAVSGIDPASVELIEAHGTGIPLGDKTELAALKSVYGPRQGTRGHIALGTVKSMIGHCIPAAGIAGLIKSALALHHRILPPTLCSRVNPELGIETTPFYINTSARPWIRYGEAPRRSAVNAFGFGGINTHAILEEAPAVAKRPPELSVRPYELFVFSAPDKDKLADRLQATASALRQNPHCSPCDLAAHLAANDCSGPFRMAITGQEIQDLLKKIETAMIHLREKAEPRWVTRSGIVYSSCPIDGRIAFMFPGEGSQYLGMFADLAMYFEEARQWFGIWRGLYGEPPGETRTDILFPPPGGLSDLQRTAMETRLHDMDVGSEAVFIAGQAMFAILRRLGITPDVMVGHSTGESSALAASGAMVYNTPEELSALIKTLNQVYRQELAGGRIATGALLSVGALPLSEIESHLVKYNDTVVIAMDNCANQVILFGPKEAVTDLQQALTAAGGICVLLPFDRGYHTPWFSAVSDAFAIYYDSIGLTLPRLPLYSCASTDLFPDDDQGVRALAAGQWSARVRFRETITRMYNDGVRYFVEIGPSGNLCSFVNDILSAKEHLALASNLPRKNDVQQLLMVLAHLYVNKKEVKLDNLFAGRAISAIDADGSDPDKEIGLRIVNTMPVIHLNPAERAVMRKILLPAPESDDARSGLSADKELPEMIDSPAPLAQNDNENGLMAEYFELMHTFLNHQANVLDCCGLKEAYLKADDQAVAPPLAAPFLNTIMELDKRHVLAACRLSVHEDNFLKHHILSGPVSEIDPELFGLSCVPLMVSLEIMAEACSVLQGSIEVAVIENVKASAWIVLEEGEVELTVHADRSDDPNRIVARLYNGDSVAVTADFVFEIARRASPLPELAEKKTFRWEGQALYRIGMFHGPVFRSIRRVEGWGEQGIDAALSEVSLEDFFVEQEAPEFVINPVLLDALGQLTAYWIAQQIGTDFNCFPSTIERIELYTSCPQQVKGLICRARQRPLVPDLTEIDAPRAWQFECLDGDGQPLLRVVNLINIYFSVPHQFYQVRRDPLNSWLGQAAAMPSVPDVLIWKLDSFSETFCTQSGGIFLNILAHILLNHEERLLWRDMETRPTLRMQWLFGRACIKEAVRFWIHRQTGRLLYPSDINVLHSELGAPYVDGWWNGTVIPAPEVSLSHSKKLSVVAVTPPNLPVGVDIEHLERVKNPDLILGAFAAGEHKMLRGFSGDDLNQRVLRVWCAKEAAAKYLGIGMNGMPQAFQVAFLDEDWRLAHVNHNHHTIEVAVDGNDHSIMALAFAQATNVKGRELCHHQPQ
jgi:acyl transferase domain-containing protein/phosphopantetheinyl transferase